MNRITNTHARTHTHTQYYNHRHLYGVACIPQIFFMSNTHPLGEVSLCMGKVEPDATQISGQMSSNVSLATKAIMIYLATMHQCHREADEHIHTQPTE